PMTSTSSAQGFSVGRLPCVQSLVPLDQYSSAYHELPWMDFDPSLKKQQQKTVKYEGLREKGTPMGRCFIFRKFVQGCSEEAVGCQQDLLTIYIQCITLSQTLHRPAVSAPLPGLFITSLPSRQRCGSGAAANNLAEEGTTTRGFTTIDNNESTDGNPSFALCRMSQSGFTAEEKWGCEWELRSYVVDPLLLARARTASAPPFKWAKFEKPRRKWWAGARGDPSSEQFTEEKNLVLNGSTSGLSWQPATREPCVNTHRCARNSRRHKLGTHELLITRHRRSASGNMPAIKKERLDGEDMALAAFNQPEYLAPLNATSIPVVTPHPPSYEHIFAHHQRAYLGFRDTALHQQHLHHHPDDFMLESFSSIPDFQPFFDNGEPCIEVECGENKALLYINKLCQGSKGPSIKYRAEWLTPNEFQFVSGRETAKDWKRSIRHKGKSLKTLMSKGILQNRGRLAEKRTIPLPPTRLPKKELASVFSSDDSEGSERASGDHTDIKQEELNYTIMRKSYERWKNLKCRNISGLDEGEEEEAGGFQKCGPSHRAGGTGNKSDNSCTCLERNTGLTYLCLALEGFVQQDVAASPHPWWLSGPECKHSAGQEWKSAGPNLKADANRDSDLSTIISNLRHNRQHGMPESQPCSARTGGCCNRTLDTSGSLERCIGLVQTERDEVKRGGRDRVKERKEEREDILGKRRAYSPNSSSECPSDSKKSRSVSPKENSHTPVLEPGSHMTPEEHYRRMMSALNEHGSYEEQQQRLYQLASNMGVPSHELLHMRQEAMAAIRNPTGLEAHVPTASSSSSQRRKQGLPQHRDAHFPERDISHPPPLLSPQSAPHIALGPHLRPPFLGMPSALCQAPGYGFLQPAQAEMFARQQEILRKQNLARLEMSAELLRHKELENLHRQRLLADPLGLHPGLPAEHPALRSLQEIPEGHPLREELGRRNAMLVLRHNTTPLLSLNHQGGAASTSCKDLSNRKSLRKGPLQGDQQGGLSETKEMLREGSARDGETEGQDEDMKDSEIGADVGEDRHERLSKLDGHSLGSELSQSKDVTKSSDTVKELAEGSGRFSVPCSSTGPDSPTHHLFTSGLSKGDAKYLPPGIPHLATLPGQMLPFTFPYTNPYLHTGTMGGLFVDGEEAGATEDISKWSVEEVFREQAIDGETLPLLTEDHLLNNMGLKLGPALKIRSQVARRIGRIFYMSSFPLALPLPPSALRPTDRDPLPTETRPPSLGSTSSSFSVPPPTCRTSPKQENGNPSTAGAYDSTKPPS
ncbi:hypothetical protein DNTS_024248, partial [Danionella cerebrum]